jgi:hypothetical protein
MRFRRPITGIIVVGLCAVASPAIGQTYDHGSLEIAMMHGLAIAGAGGDNATVIMTPVPPVWRLSYWTPTGLQAEFGFSLFHATEDDYDATVMNLEGGLGTNLAPRGSKTVPFVTGLGGLLNIGSDDDSETNFYLGGSVGVRTFFRDYVAVRFQASLRNILVDGDSVRVFEFVGGLSFFL